MQTPSQIAITENQVNGVVNVASMRRMLGRVSDKASDARLLTELEHPADIRDVDPTSPAEAVVSAAAQRLDQRCDYVFAGPIDTCDPELWLALRAIASDASLVALFPHLCFEGLESPYGLVRMAAFALDVASRAACARTRHTAIPHTVMTEPTVRKRTLTVTADIVAGRIGAWILMTEIIGAQTAMMADLDWDGLADAHTALSVMETAIAVNEALHAKGEPNADESSFDVTSFSYLTFADVWDARQRTSAEGTDLSAWSMRELLEDGPKDDAALVASLGGTKEDDVTDYVGLFGINPIRALTFAPSSFTETLSALYRTQEHVYELGIDNEGIALE